MMENRWASEKTLLKLVANILRKSPMAKGYKVKTLNGVEKITAEELIQFVEYLAEALHTGEYGRIQRCKTCGRFDPDWCGRGRGWCPEFVAYKTNRDFCSAWTPLTEQQKEQRKRRQSFELGQVQTKRAGNSSKNSRKGN